MNVPELPPDERQHLPVLIDFDGTLAEGTWPSPVLGAPIPEGIELLVAYAEAGYAIKVFTARPASHKDRIWTWLAQLNLAHVVYDVITDKPMAGLYVDDRAFNPKELYARARETAREEEVGTSTPPRDWEVVG